MALNLSKISKTFKRKATLTVYSDKGSPIKQMIDCEFQRTTKEAAQAFDDELAQAVGSEKDALIEARLEEVWLGWDVIDDDGKVDFSLENRKRLYNILAGSLTAVYVAYVQGVLGLDRKNV